MVVVLKVAGINVACINGDGDKVDDSSLGLTEC